jgi:Ran GTPase-activating protein (RanGAP) involved in mRNA processing and transport
LDLKEPNSTLQTINLGVNSIGDEGAKAVAEALKVNSTLQTIFLDNNGIGAEGAKAVAESIKVNSTLQTIDLGYNYIEDEGAKAVAEAIKVNSMLETLGLLFCFGEDLESQVAETLQEIRSRKERNYRKFICAFTAYQVDSARLRFDKMTLRYVCYPILGVSEKNSG